MTTGDRTDFWSRRKAAVRAEAEALEAGARPAADVSAPVETRTDAEVLSSLGLRDPDTLVAGDDFAAFLRHEVPLHLRQRALRRLWRSNPVLANLDGLVDHGEDYTDRAVVPPALATAYKVGRGMLAHLQAATADLVEEVAEAPVEPVLANQSEPPQIDPDDADVTPVARADEPAAVRRHMRFTFKDHLSGGIEA